MTTLHLNELGQPIGPPVPGWKPPPPPPREPMEGRSCRLEPLDAARHAAALFEANSLDGSGASFTYLPYGPFSDAETYRDWVARMSARSDPLFFAIVDVRTGGPAGVASFLRIEPGSGSIEVGHLHFSPALQRTLIATEAMYLMMRRVFELGYRRYEWKCDSLNAPSRTAAQRLGFSFEGVFRQALVVRGRNRDTAWYSVIDSEWPALQAGFEAWLSADNFDENGRQRSRLSAMTAPLLKCAG